MGSYLNPGSERFRTSLRSQIYVDKSLLIAEINKLVRTEQKYVCVSRPRRFGKSMAADMLLAYYSAGEDTSALFDGLKISRETSYREHLNQYDVIKINMQEFLSATHDVDEMLRILQKRVLMELKKIYPDIEGDRLVWAMMDVYAQTGRPFIILIDEWDCLFREYVHDTEAQKKYLDFLRMWLKDQTYVALAYMTGILPIKKYGSHSALNMFSEYSMTNARELAPYFGFTEDEVKALCERYKMSFEEAKAWYDGYELVELRAGGKVTFHSMYSPKSVVDAMLSHVYDTYWNQTETYEALKVYIQMNLDGLKDAVLQMLAGERVEVNTGTFTNDMTTFSCRDDVLTLLVHLGYLSYRRADKTVSIPNKEVSQEYVNAISTMSWGEVMRSITDSKKLLESLWDMDAEAVAKGIDRAHEEISILKYNDENSLSCTISLAFYFAREYYTIVRELPTGKGFADLCLIPRRLHSDKPAVVIELKKDQDAVGAIAQIKKKNYVKALEDYKGNLLLVGINYDQDKKHTCVIEKMEL